MFDTFLKCHYPNSKCATVNVTQELMGQFGTYMVNSTIKHQTAMNYMSSLQRQLYDECGVMIFKNDVDWTARLEATMTKAFATKCRHDGTVMKTRARAMTSSDMLSLVNMLFRRNDALVLKDITLLACQWTAIHQSSDVGPFFSRIYFGRTIASLST